MYEATRDLLSAVQRGRRPDAAEALALAAEDDLPPLLDCASVLRDRAHPDIVTYSRKVFIPLTHLCRDVCHYCTFARPPRRGETAFMTPEQVLRVAQAGAAAGCKEALFTLGDKPELRYRAARENLEALGYGEHARLPRGHGEAGAGGDAAAAAPQSGCAEPRRPGRAACGLRLAGHDARERVRAALRQGRASLRLAGQAAGSTARDAPPGRRGGGAVHLRHPHRHWRNPGGADRGPARAPRFP